MKYSIIYSSKTGNTEQLANHLKEILPQDDCIYYGKPNVIAKDADLLFIGTWIDKGTCSEEIQEFLKGIEDKKIFLFGTCGFGESEQYFLDLSERIQKNINPSCSVLGSFLCQGKMPMIVRERYSTMFANDPEKAKNLIDNFDRALSHPDANDLISLEKAVLNCIE